LNLVGVMQGRLSPPLGGRIQAFPKASWREEFAKAKACGLETIEWIFEAEEWEKNPVLADPGEVAQEAGRHGVQVLSVCGDYLMDRPLVRTSLEQQRQGVAVVHRLIESCGRLGVRYIGLPFVDSSALQTEAEMDEVAHCLRPCLDAAQRQQMTLAFETSLGPNAFRMFLDKLDHPSAGVNYDIGNSASLGFDTREEIRSYGESVATVHVKDRVLGGGSVALGEGDADFDRTFQALARIDFTGPFILQAARGGDEVEVVRGYGTFVRSYLRKYFS
jgi:L-ribulose-5-phosphate 3-epimerase